METEAWHSEKELGCDSLAARLADGDPGASREIVERHYAGLYRYAFAMLRDGPAAEDAVHDAFERAFRALGRYPEKRIRSMTLRPWLYRITLNVVRNRVRRRREVTVGNVSALSPEAIADEGVADRMAVLAALRRLPERQKKAVALRYLQDLPYAEISAVTGWPEGTAKTLVHRGVGRLREFMGADNSKDGDP